MRLRHWLASITLSAPLAGCCITDTIDEENGRFLPDMPDAAVAQEIADCKLGMCKPLCAQFAPAGAHNCRLKLVDGKDFIAWDESVPCEAGRRPAGWRGVRACGSEVGAYLAAQAALEAASVDAFHHLHDDLVALGAPPRLADAARRAAGDEVRHARLCARMACSWGGRAERPVVPPARRRSRRELAIDNAVEGCVRETYGAAVAWLQASRACGATTRRALGTIARDESAHAELAWHIHGWLAPQLTRNERSAVTAAARTARAELRVTRGTSSPVLRHVLGLPDAAAAHHLLDAVTTLRA